MHILLTMLAGVLGGGQPVAIDPAVPVFSDTVVVSASLDSTDREKIPASVTVIDAREIEARQVTNLSEALSLVPGFTVSPLGSLGQQTSVFTRGSESDQTLLLWNGIALNDPYFGGANWQFIPTDGVERIEVVRGPFSALYGSTAMGGVVQVLSGSRDGGSLHLEGGENGYGRIGLAAGWGGDHFRLDVAGHLRRGDGELANDFFDSEEGTVHAVWTPRPGATIGVLVRADDSDTGIPRDGGRVSPNRRIAWREREIAVPLRAQGDRWEVEGQVSRTEFDSEFRDPDDPFGFTGSDTSSEALRGRAVASLKVRDGLRLSFGSDVERLEVSSSSVFGTNFEGAHQRSWAVFGQASYGHGPLQLELGARRDDNDVYGGQTSARAGAVLALGSGVRLRASYGESFRAPSIGELFFPGSGNPGLRPETGESFEAGIESDAGAWHAGLTGFENRQTDLIDFEFVTFTNVNVGRTRSRGLEGELAYRRGVFAASFNATYLEAEDLGQRSPLLRRPKESANLSLSARPGAWTLSLTGRYVGARPDVDPVTFARAENPSYSRFDLAARRTLLPWLTPYARVENLADESYGPALGFPAPGRTWIGGVAVDF
jgi:vitamin B12 transporter